MAEWDVFGNGEELNIGNGIFQVSVFSSGSDGWTVGINGHILAENVETLAEGKRLAIEKLKQSLDEYKAEIANL